MRPHGRNEFTLNSSELELAQVILASESLAETLKTRAQTQQAAGAETPEVSIDLLEAISFVNASQNALRTGRPELSLEHKRVASSLFNDWLEFKRARNTSIGKYRRQPKRAR